MPKNTATVSSLRAEIHIDNESFFKLMSRGLNTLEPERWPEWARQLEEVNVLSDQLVLVIRRKTAAEAGA